MQSFQISAEVPEDRRVTLQLPPDTPLGPATLGITITAVVSTQKRPRGGLAEWFDQQAEDWCGHLNSEDVEGFTGRSF